MICEKHKIQLTRIDAGHGKTMDICEQCEKEKQELFRKIFREDLNSILNKFKDSL